MMINRFFRLLTDFLRRQTPLSAVSGACFAMVFLLGFDRRTDGLCALLALVICLAVFLLLAAPHWRTLTARWQSMPPKTRFVATALAGGSSLASCWRSMPRGMRVCLASLAGWVALTGVSHFWSWDAGYTAESFFREVLPQAGMFVVMLWLGVSCSSGPMTRGLAALAGALSGLALVMTGVMAMAAALPDWRPAMDKLQLILLNHEDPAAPWRALFPCNTHNKTGFWCMVMFYVQTAALLCVPRKSRRRFETALWSVGLAATAVVLMGTLTRGVMLSLGAGVAVMFAVLLSAGAASARRLRVLAVCVAVLAVAGLFAAPKSWRDYVAQPFSAESWVPNAETTTGMRLFIWQHTMTMIGERPLLGHGGGWEIYQHRFEERFPEAEAQMPRSEFPAHHSHNVYLQVAFETGVIGLMLFVLFQLGRLATVFRGLAAARRGDNRAHLRLMAGVLAVELSFQMYCFSNYPMRRGMGLLMFIAWGACAAAAWRVLRDSERRTDQISAE